MKKRLIVILCLSTFFGLMILYNAFGSSIHDQGTLRGLSMSQDPLKKSAFHILQTKCNFCHRKKNPFMIFNERNMVKRAAKIYTMVFVERRMPKGDEISLSSDEYATLKKWLFTQEIF